MLREGLKENLAAPARRGPKNTRRFGLDEEVLSVLVALCSISRIQWLSLLFARLLCDVGYSSVKVVGQADGEIYSKVDAPLSASVVLAIRWPESAGLAII